MRKSLNSVASWQSGGGGGQRGAKGVGCYRAAAIRGGEHSVVVKGGSRSPFPPLSLSCTPCLFSKCAWRCRDNRGWASKSYLSAPLVNFPLFPPRIFPRPSTGIGGPACGWWWGNGAATAGQKAPTPFVGRGEVGEQESNIKVSYLSNQSVGEICCFRTSVSASCSPALARKTSLDTSGANASTLSNNDEEQGCSGAVSSMSNKVLKIFSWPISVPTKSVSLFQVSDDINEMVEQIQAIQLDISELAGRPISLVGGSKPWKLQILLLPELLKHAPI